VSIYVTSASSDSTDSHTEKTKELSASSQASFDIEKSPPAASSALTSELSTKQGRPGVAAIISDIVGRSNRNDRIAIAACGPSGMIQIARKASADSITVEGPSVELHVEHFGW